MMTPISATSQPIQPTCCSAQNVVIENANLSKKGGRRRCPPVSPIRLILCTARFSACGLTVVRGERTRLETCLLKDTHQRSSQRSPRNELLARQPFSEPRLLQSDQSLALWHIADH